MDEQGFPIIPPRSQDPRHPNHIDVHQQPLPDHVLQPTPRQYPTVPKFQGNYGNERPPPMLQSTPRYPESSRTIKQEQDVNAYLYSSPTDFRGEMNLNIHHPTHAEHDARYPPAHNPYPSDLNRPSAGGLPVQIGMSSTRLESPETRLLPGPAETGPADFSYQMHALQPQHHRHQHGPLPHHQHQNHPLNHMQGPAFFSPSMGYSPLDQEHGNTGGGALDRQSHTQLSSLEYNSRQPHAQHVPVSTIVYEPLPHELTVPGHSQQDVRHDTTLNHHGSLASINSNNPGSGSYHTTNSPTSIPMSNKHNRGTVTSMNTSGPGTHTSPSFSMGTNNSSRWVGHPSDFDLANSTAGATSIHMTSPAASSLGPTFRHADSGSRSSPENTFIQDNSRLRPSISAQTLSSSQSTHSHTNSPSPRLSDTESTIGGRRLGSELFSQDDRESDQDVDTNERVVRMSKKGSAGRKEVRGAGEEVGESFLAPAKKKKKSKMHRCEVCDKKFPRPSGLKTHMNTHNNEKPYPCGFPGCARTFGVRSNAKRHLRTHGVVTTPLANPSSIEAPYVVGFCPPMVLAPQQSSSYQQSQLHSLEGGEDMSPGIRLIMPGDNVNTHPQGQSDVQRGVGRGPMKLRWMPPSLTTRTNARSLREVRDGQQVRGMGEGIEEGDEEDEDDLASGSGIGGVRGTSGYDMEMEMEMEQDDMEDTVGDGDDGDFGDNIPRLNISLHPVMPSSSTSSAAVVSSSGIRLAVSRPAGCICSPPCSESSTQGRCRSSPSLSRTFTSLSSTSFARSSGSMSSPTTSTYGQRELEMTGVIGSGGGVYNARTGTVSREYDVWEPPRTEERNSYPETESHPYHPSKHPKHFH